MDDFDGLYQEYSQQAIGMLDIAIETSKINDVDVKELIAFLGFLHGLRMMHHAHHWQSSGTNAYGDHLLYMRLYEAIDQEIDTLAEKIVGMGGLVGTNYFVTANNIKLFLETCSQGTTIEDDSLRGELVLLIVGEHIIQKYKASNRLTSGLEQALGNILDKHETHAYLLQQRRN